MAVNKLLALSGNHFLHTLDVLYGHLVVRVGYARVAVLFLVEQRQLALLVGQEYDLIVNHRLRIRYIVRHGHQIHRHFRVVDLYVRIGAYHGRQRGIVHIHKAVHLATLVAHRYRLIVRLEVRHRHDAVFEVHGEIAIHILACLGFVQELRLHAAVMQLVVNLAYLYQEVAPLLVVEREQAAFLRFLRDSQVAKAVRVAASLEIAEIGR